jgi:hypothetical protein
MGDELLKWWPVIAALGAMVWGGWMFIDRLRSRISAVEAEHAAHEEVCNERWAAVMARHLELVKATDERHKENVDRFDRLDDKIDLVLEHLLKKRLT